MSILGPVCDYVTERLTRYGVEGAAFTPETMGYAASATPHCYLAETIPSRTLTAAQRYDNQLTALYFASLTLHGERIQFNRINRNTSSFNSQPQLSVVYNIHDPNALPKLATDCYYWIVYSRWPVDTHSLYMILS